MRELDKTGFGGDRKAPKYTEPKIKQIQSKVSAQAEKADFNFPKTLFGVGIAGAAAVVKFYVPLMPFMEGLFWADIGMSAAGVGLKINRIKGGGDVFKNEKNLFKKLTFKK